MSIQERALQLITYLTNHGINGAGPLCSAEDLAQEYASDSGYDSIDARVRAMIRWESSKSFCSGFATGLGGVATMPVGVPASIYAAWVVQARLVAAIAHLYGHDVQSDRVRTFVLLSLLADGGREVLKQAGIQIGNKTGLALLKKVPGRVLIEINKKVGHKLLTKFGEKGVLNLVKAVPYLGGAVGGTVDALATAAVGNGARATFHRAA